MKTIKQVPAHRLAALIEYATSDGVYGITREDRKVLNVLRGVDDLAEEKKQIALGSNFYFFISFIKDVCFVVL